VFINDYGCRSPMPSARKSVGHESDLRIRQELFSDFRGRIRGSATRTLTIGDIGLRLADVGESAILN